MPSGVDMERYRDTKLFSCRMPIEWNVFKRWMKKQSCSRGNFSHITAPVTKPHFLFILMHLKSSVLCPCSLECSAAGKVTSECVIPLLISVNQVSSALDVFLFFPNSICCTDGILNRSYEQSYKQFLYFQVLIFYSLPVRTSLNLLVFTIFILDLTLSGDEHSPWLIPSGLSACESHHAI